MKYAIFLFNDDEMCMVHAFLYVRELNENGVEARLILEGRATKVPKMYRESGLIGRYYEEAKEKSWIDCVCRACSVATDSLSYAEKEGLRICGDLNGHVSILSYINRGYGVLVMG
ncbi:hypothetical protein [Archaeoglobus neptunius]|uniref:hypothetical protein n=1 Tax=Archaeoglobus neptunius TaxID=2798580 RepID=UPI0019281189|nr:hypothetical protein [Archaeoglobus neptunius]